jgi:acetyl-CoA acetyltransferase
MTADPPGREFARVLAQSAIVGLGITDTGKVYGRSGTSFAAEAARLAVADAGLRLDDVDGLIFSNGVAGGVTLRLARELGLRDLPLLTQMSSAGATAVVQIQTAAMAIAAGRATTVVCVHADAPLRGPTDRGGEIYGRRPDPRVRTPFESMALAGQNRGANYGYALAAQRHIARFGTTSEQLAAIAVAQRQWATLNPRARFREPISIEDHQNSRWIVEPLHLLDCCMVSNGGVAVVVTGVERAKNLQQSPVYLLGSGQSHPGYSMRRGCEFGITTGAVRSGAEAMGMAGITPADVDICELYDCYTYTVLVTLEDYGFCAKGEGGAFVEDGKLGPGGSLPTNTGGGQLSGFYLWGMTPLSEAVLQARGDAGERQVAKHNVVLVSGNGGLLDYHASLVVSPLEPS